MRPRLLIPLVVACLGTAAVDGIPVHDLIARVEAALDGGQSDREVARSLHKLKLSERLDESAIEQLESEGAGSGTVAELRRLQTISAALPRPPAALSPDSRPPPSPEEQKRMVEQARENALNYTQSLPDFLCTEVVRRYNDYKDRLLDTLTLRLRYFDRREHYQLLAINGRPTALTYDDVGGVITGGEFGSLLNQVFDRASATEFRWNRWTVLRKRPVQVYGFRVAAGKSRYRMEAHGAGDHLTAAVGQRGVVYVDPENGRTLRVIAESEGLPLDFPVKSAATTLDFDFVEIGGRQFLLPLRAETRMRAVDMQTRNEVRFSGYQKFAADTNITFDPH
jgi:hypothetical protein